MKKFTLFNITKITLRLFSMSVIIFLLLNLTLYPQASTNLALGKSVTVSTYQNDPPSVYPGSNITDGDTGNESRWSASGFPQWAEIDLGLIAQVSEIQLFTYKSRAYQYIVEASSDGTNYTTIVDRSSNTSSTQPMTNSVNTNARYIKITISGAAVYTGTWVSLTELIVIGQEIMLDEYYCDPVNGSMSNIGSQSSPWGSLQEVFAAGKTFTAGDIIYLMDGDHGTPYITANNTADVTITKAPGHNPIIEHLRFSGASHWILNDVKVSTNGQRVPTDPPLSHPVYPLIQNSLVQIYNNSSYITIEDCYICSVDDASGWTADDWNYHAWNGIYHELTDHVTIRNCTIKNVNFGIHNDNGTSVSNTLYEYNLIENFTGDGLRGHGINTVIQYNIVQNAYETNGNHVDMIQVVGTTTGLVLRGNKFINYTDPNQPFRATAQGIAFFNGMYYDFVIENNLVAVDHWHGISLYGANNCKIINNTLIDQNSVSPGPAWIKITAAPDGTLSTNNVIRNNICNTISSDANIGTVENNLQISFSGYNSVFADPDNLDFNLITGSPAIDAGSATGAPDIDIEGTPRPQDNGYDIGAYEFISPTIQVTGVSVAPTNAILTVGEQIQLSETVQPTDASNQTVSWSSDNTSVATVDANGVVSAMSTGQAIITVTTNDGGFTATCPVTVSDNQQGGDRTETIEASTDDLQINSDGTSRWIGSVGHRVGGAAGGVDGCSVHPFQLPALNQDEVILSAHFSISLSGISNSPQGNVDLYALPYRSTSTVDPVGDYWQGTYGADGNATALQDDFAVLSTPIGTVATNSAADINLTDYINAQYAAGAQAGDYIFIRLNPDVADVTNYYYWTFTSANGTPKPILELEIGTNSAPWDVITFDDFESGFGNFKDGGGDCSLYTGGTYAHQGSNAGLIQDNQGVYSSFYYLNSVDLSSYSQLKIDFWFYGLGMNDGHDFFVEYSDDGGVTWQIISTYVQGSGNDFVNGQFYSVADGGDFNAVVIDNSAYNFTSNAKIRFRCDGSQNDDQIYIDEVNVTGTTSAAKKAVKSIVQAMSQTLAVSAFPNPCLDELNVRISGAVSDVCPMIQLFDISGKKVFAKQMDGVNQLSIPTGSFDKGIYILSVSVQGKAYRQKVIKTK